VPVSQAAPKWLLGRIVARNIEAAIFIGILNIVLDDMVLPSKAPFQRERTIHGTIPRFTGLAFADTAAAFSLSSYRFRQMGSG
jgi:hypothetical protein